MYSVVFALRILKMRRFLLTCACLSLLQACSWGQVVLNQVDDFEDGTSMNWFGGFGPVNVGSGGPAGANDNYLAVTGTGSIHAGGVPATYNDAQWSGNWIGAGVKVLAVDLKNFSSSDMSLRLVGHYVGSRWTSTDPIVVPALGTWKTYYFSMNPNHWTLVLGTDPFNTAFSGLNRFMIRNQSGPPDPGGTPLNGTFGMDNMRALADAKLSVESLTIVEGQLLGGGVANLATSNNSYLLLLNDEFDSNATVHMTTTCPFKAGITSLRTTFEASASRNDLSQILDLKNQASGNFEQIHFQLSTLTDTTASPLITNNPSRFVNSSTGEILLRVRYIPTGDVDAADGWGERIDFVQHTVVP